MKLNELMEEDHDEATNMGEHRALLERYPTEEGVEPNWINLKEIVVGSERDKQQILQALKYLHDNRTIDTDFLAVNTLVHVYTQPDMVKVRS